jgi:hypothetical protein
MSETKFHTHTEPQAKLLENSTKQISSVVRYREDWQVYGIMAVNLCTGRKFTDEWKHLKDG